MKVLIVSPAYAPFGGVGSARMISLTEYLVQQGDSVTVLCNSPSCWPSDTLTQFIPKGVDIRHVDVLNENEVTLRATHNAQVYRDAMENLIRETLPDVCVCTIGPYYIMHFIWKLKVKYGLRYVIDYRDPWFTAHEKGAGFLRNAKKLYIAARLFQKERRCLVHAAASVSVVEPFRKHLARLHPAKQCEFHCIRNGYDEKALAKAHPTDPCPGKISIVLSGKFAKYNPPAAKALFDAVASINKNGYAVKIVHIGPHENNIEELMRCSVGFDPDDFVPLGHRPYAECLSLIKGARACLINYKDMMGLGTKVFDYIGANKPIIAFTPSGSEMAKLLATFPHAYRCSSADDAIRALTSIIAGGISTLYAGDMGKEYARSASNEKYRELLGRICCNSEHVKGQSS